MTNQGAVALTFIECAELALLLPLEGLEQALLQQLHGVAHVGLLVVYSHQRTGVSGSGAATAEMDLKSRQRERV